MIEQLTSTLPEIYQPIYGHPELSSKISRPCIDRLEHIARIYDALQRLLGRPLKVLDLGCAQGFFSFSLAERGAIVHGVDFLKGNIDLCNALALENPSFSVSFETSRIENVIESLEPGQYDLVLCLSVLHHIIYEKGVDSVKSMLEYVAAHSGALIVELALREEPLYWATAQPEDPLTLLDSIAFIYEVAHHSTHLSSISRPLYVASNRYWILGDSAANFESWSLDPHAMAHGVHAASRRYFFSADSILKLYRFDHPHGDSNKTEFNNEIRFLQQPPKGFPAPLLIAFGQRESDGWLIMQRLPGRLLLDLMREGIAIEPRAVLLTVLEQLAVLETAGLYHDDVRTWNVLVANDGAIRLIDYGSISSKVRDCVWPYNLFLSFFIFVREVSTGIVDDPNPLRTVSISPYGLPQPYRAWAMSLWNRPLKDWSFRLFYQTLLEMPDDMGIEPLQQPLEAWMLAIEDAIEVQKKFIRHTTQQAESKAQQAESRAQQAESKAQQAESRAQQAESRAQQAEAAAKEILLQLNAVYASTSWRVTAPLRAISRGVHSLTLAPRTIKSGIKQGLRSCAAQVARRPRLKRLALVILNRMPTLKARLKQVTGDYRNTFSSSTHQPAIPLELHQLSPRARQIYANLKSALAKRRGEK